MRLCMMGVKPLISSPTVRHSAHHYARCSSCQGGSGKARLQRSRAVCCQTFSESGGVSPIGAIVSFVPIVPIVPVTSPPSHRPIIVPSFLLSVSQQLACACIFLSSCNPRVITTPHAVHHPQPSSALLRLKEGRFRHPCHVVTHL